MTMRITHFFCDFEGLGGVQSVLRHHHAQDGRAGLDSEFLIYEGAVGRRIDRVHPIGPSKRDSLAKARARAARHLHRHKPEIAVYHGMWGIPHFADLDGAARRIMVIHGQTPRMERDLSERLHWLDGVLCVSEPLRRQLAPIVWPCPERLGLLPYPIEARIGGSSRDSARLRRNFVIGFCGRLEREQKRVDLLPAFVKELDRLGVRFLLDILGSGSAENWLKTQFAGDNRTTVLGMLTGDAYWHRVQSWDAMVFLSDYEGLPIALLEGMSQGVIPVFPIIGSGGDDYVGRVDGQLLYQHGNVLEAAAILDKLAQSDAAEIESLRNRCRDTVRVHGGDSYMATFGAFLSNIAALPRVSSENAGKRRPWTDRVPTGLLGKLTAVRSRATRLAARLRIARP